MYCWLCKMLTSRWRAYENSSCNTFTCLKLFRNENKITQSVRIVFLNSTYILLLSLIICTHQVNYLVLPAIQTPYVYLICWLTGIMSVMSVWISCIISSILQPRNTYIRGKTTPLLAPSSVLNEWMIPKAYLKIKIMEEKTRGTGNILDCKIIKFYE